MRSIAVGDVRVRDLFVGVGDFFTVLSTAAGAEVDGIIGHNFLSLFRVTIDYPGSTLGLLPIASSVALEDEVRCQPA